MLKLAELYKEFIGKKMNIVGKHMRNFKRDKENLKKQHVKILALENTIS